VKTIQITKREQHVLMTVVRTMRQFLGDHLSCNGNATWSVAVVERIVSNGPITVPLPEELESLLERLGDE